MAMSFPLLLNFPHSSQEVRWEPGKNFCGE